jgi:hypothetical protein
MAETDGLAGHGDCCVWPRMAKTTGARKDQKKRSQGTSRSGPTNQYQPRGNRRSIGSSKPGGDGPGKKKWTKE